MSAGDSGLTPVEQHLGDRLAALVDGELGDDARDRVLSHLATCHGCKAEADAQRQLKNVFAGAAPPPPSDGLLARLQGLPAGSDPEPEEGPPGGGGSFPATGVRNGQSPLTFEYLPSGRGPSVLTPEHGFPVHATPQEPERGSASRSRRFAFVAAGAFSVAALALSGPLNSVASGGSPVASGERGKGTAAGADRGASSSPDREVRRRTTTGSASTASTPSTTRQQSARLGAPNVPRAATAPAVRAELTTSMAATAPAHPLARRAMAFTPELIRPPALTKPLPSKSQREGGVASGQSPAAAVPSPTSAVPSAP